VEEAPRVEAVVHADELAGEGSDLGEIGDGHGSDDEAFGHDASPSHDETQLGEDVSVGPWLL